MRKGVIGINYVGNKNNELKGCMDDVLNLYDCLTNFKKCGDTYFEFLYEYLQENSR